ncbi:hypothetical protein UNSW1_406 [Campylobacter concisus UNSW1]|nr:hypothetical protein UNSW1_406 [Campylobacter concisus UNSW1]
MKFRVAAKTATKFIISRLDTLVSFLLQVLCQFELCLVT